MKKYDRYTELKRRRIMAEENSILEEGCELHIDKWHDTCCILPDCCEDIWFIADGKINVGIYEPEQKLFCMADCMGIDLKNVRQWRYIGTSKQIAKYPKEKQIVAASVPGFPCLITGIFTDHCYDEATGDEFSGLILDDIYCFDNCCDCDCIKWDNVFYWYELPEEPLALLEPVGDSVLAVFPDAQTIIVDETGETVEEISEEPTEVEESDTDAGESSIAKYSSKAEVLSDEEKYMMESFKRNYKKSLKESETEEIEMNDVEIEDIEPIQESFEVSEDNVWYVFDTLGEMLGWEELCLSLAKAMGTDRLRSDLEYICRVTDVEFEDEEEEEESVEIEEPVEESIDDFDFMPESLSKQVREYLNR